jgi:putative transposase
MDCGDSERSFGIWAHSPAHWFAPGFAYIVTAGTYQKRHHFESDDRRTLLLTTLFEEAERFGWSLQAWAVLSNHYHFVAHAPEDATSLVSMIRRLHSRTARQLNKEDIAPGRRVWFQYWDTCLTNERSYLARLNYVHHNPEKHGLVALAENYPWCSMAWFLHESEANFRRTVLSFKYDRISINDVF